MCVEINDIVCLYIQPSNYKYWQAHLYNRSNKQMNKHNDIASILSPSPDRPIQKYTRTNIKAMSVSAIGAKLWNELDSDLRHIKHILLFKKIKMGHTTNVRITYHMSILALKNVR